MSTIRMEVLTRRLFLFSFLPQVTSASQQSDSTRVLVLGTASSDRKTRTTTRSLFIEEHDKRTIPRSLRLSPLSCVFLSSLLAYLTFAATRNKQGGKEKEEELYSSCLRQNLLVPIDQETFSCFHYNPSLSRREKRVVVKETGSEKTHHTPTTPSCDKEGKIFHPLFPNNQSSRCLHSLLPTSS